MSSKAKHHKTPLIGRVDTGFKGVAVLENKLYRAPIFWHKMAPTDFLMIKHEGDYVVRKASGFFTVGQEEPKLEVFNPATRAATAFFKRRT